jgi:hypothetical protein
MFVRDPYPYDFYLSAIVFTKLAAKRRVLLTQTTLAVFYLTLNGNPKINQRYCLLPPHML